MSTNTDKSATTTCPPPHDTLVVMALRDLAENPTCHLPLPFAIDAAVVAAHLATDSEAVQELGTDDVQEICEELTSWSPDEDDVELIEETAEYLRGEIVRAAGDTPGSL